MKYILLFLLFLSGVTAEAQSVSFSYDSAGNQISRTWCALCPGKMSSGGVSKNEEDITEEDLEKFHPEDIVSYYPNPVQEQLYLKWSLVDDKRMVEINLYNSNGQLIKSVKNLQNTDHYLFPFQTLPEGIYTLNLTYTNGKQEPIKIIKNKN
ncbi:T9SS type A sorting domain-containing protein [Flavobacterium sp. GCM10023249]|uniref:T9SS type A sorting domain-containing protein n=1 Tax=unclassified Flavobacterium TaxID=196869 RepID=UPI00361C71D4